MPSAELQAILELNREKFIPEREATRVRPPVEQEISISGAQHTDPERLFSGQKLNETQQRQAQDFTNITQILMNTNPDAADVLEVQAINSKYMKSLRGMDDPTGRLFFGKDHKPRELMKAIHNLVDPARYSDLFKSRRDEFEALDEKGKDEFAYKEGKTWGILPPLEAMEETETAGFNPANALGMNPSTTAKGVRVLPLDEMSPAARKKLRGRVYNKILRKEYTFLRNVYENNLSEKSKAFVRESIKTGKWDSNVFMMLPDAEKRHAAEYRSLLEAPTDFFIGTEIAVRATKATWNIIGGGVEYVGWQALRAGAAGYDLSTDSADGERWMMGMEKAREDVELSKIATSLKYPERGFAGKMFTGFADTLPYMIAMSIAPVGTVAFGVPAAGLLATSSMAKGIERELIAAGTDPEFARLAAPVVATANAYIEKLQANQLISALTRKQVISSAHKTIMSVLSQRLTKGAAGFNKTFVLETGEEVTQGLTQEFATQLGLGEKDMQKYLDVAADTVEEVMPTMVLFGLGGAVGGFRASLEPEASILKKEGALSAASEQLSALKKVMEVNWDSKKAFNDAFTAWKSIRDTDREDEFLQTFTDPDAAIEIFEREAETRESQVEAAVTLLDEELSEYKDGVSIAGILSTIKRLGIQVPAIVVQSVSDLPAPILEADTTNAVHRMAGAADGSRIYVVADNIGTMERAEQVVIHEAIGHIGLEFVFGDKLNILSKSIYGDKHLKGQIDIHGQRLGLDMQSEEGQILATQEYLARMSETAPLSNTAWQKTVATVRQWLKDIGLSSKWTDNDIRALFAKAAIAATDVEVGKQLQSEADIDSLAKDPKYSKRQKADPLRNAAVVFAHQMLQGAKISTRVVATYLEKIGQKAEQAQEVLNQAERISAKFQVSIKEAKNDPAILDQLEQTEIRNHYSQIISQISSEGITEGVVFEKAVQSAKKLSQARVKAKLSGLHGLTIKQLKSAGIVVPEGLDGLDDFLTATEEHIRKQLIREKVFTGRRKTFRQNAQFRIQLAKTLSNVLHERVRQSIAGSRKSQLAKRVGTLGTTTQYSSIVNDFNKLAHDIYKHRVQQTDKQLTKAWKDQLKRETVNKPLSARKLLIDRNVREVVNKKTGETRLVGDVHPETKKWVDLVKGINDRKARITSIEARAIIKDLTNYQNSGADMEAQMIADLFSAWEIRIPALKRYQNMDLFERSTLFMKALNNQGYFRERTLLDKAQAVADLKKDIDSGIERLHKIFQDRREALRPVKDANLALGSLPKVSKEKSNVQAALATLFGGRAWFRFLADKLGGSAKENLLKENEKLLRRINRSSQIERLRMAELRVEFMGVVSELYKGDPIKVLRRLSKANAELGKKYSLYGNMLSLQNVMQLYVSSVQSDYADTAERHPRDVAGMAKEFSEADWGLINWMRDHYLFARPELSAKNKELTGVDIGMQNPLWMPAAIATPLGGTPEIHKISSIVPPSMTERVKHKQDFDEEVGMVDIFMSRSTENIHYLSWADTAIMLRGVYADGEVQEAIQNAIGKAGLSGFLNMMADTVAGQFNPDADRSGKIGTQYISNLRKYWIFSKFNLNVRIGSKQPTSFPAFGLEIGLVNVAKHTASAMSSDGIEAMKEIFNHPLAKERRTTGFTEELQHVLNSSTPTEFQRWMHLATFPNRYGDIVPTLIVGQGIYRSKWQSLVTMEGYGESKAKQEAMSQLFELVESTQQSGQFKDFSYWQRRGGVFGKILTTFTNTQRQFLEKEITTAIHLFENLDSKEAWGDAGRVITINHVLLPAAYNGMNMILNAMLGQEPDEEDWWLMAASMLSGPSAGFIVFGSMINAMMEGAVTGKMSIYDAITPFSGVVKDSRMFAIMLHHMMTLDEQALVDILDAMGKSFLPPYRELQKFRSNK